jgi:very-short-patch-repair endonuclease
MREPVSTDHRIGALASRQYGVVARRQLIGAGIDRGRIDRSIAAGRLLRLHTGVYAVGHRSPRDEARWIAATLACGGVLSHLSAAALWRLIVRDNGLTHVTAASDLRHARIHVHRARLRPADRTIHSRIPVTSVGRTLADLAHVLDDEALHRAVREAQFRRLFDEDAIRDVLVRRPAARLKAYLGDATLTQTELEDRFLRICRRHGVPTPSTQYGAKPRVDFIWHDERVIVEVDGWEAHSTRVAFQQDRSTTNTLLLAGYLVLRFTYEDVLHRSQLVTSQVRQALAA